MSETPKPPGGYETWLACVADGIPEAHAELSALRAHIEEALADRHAFERCLQTKVEEVDELSAKLAAAKQEAARLREALLTLHVFTLPDGPCWCDDRPNLGRKPGPHEPECVQARAALASGTDSSKAGGGSSTLPVRGESAEREPVATAPGPRLQTCPACDGTGLIRKLNSRRVVVAEPCWKCHGSGTIPVEESR